MKKMNLNDWTKRLILSVSSIAGAGLFLKFFAFYSFEIFAVLILVFLLGVGVLLFSSIFSKDIDQIRSNLWVLEITTLLYYGIPGVLSFLWEQVLGISNVITAVFIGIHMLDKGQTRRNLEVSLSLGIFTGIFSALYWSTSESVISTFLTFVIPITVLFTATVILER